MNIKTLYILLLVLVIPMGIQAQKKGKSLSKFKAENPVEELSRAEGLKDKSPVDAIALIEEVIAEERRKKRGSNLLGRAYFLLGNIYEQIDQDELAIDRYITALSSVPKKDDKLTSQISYRLGVIHLQKRDEAGANKYFDQAIHKSTSKDITLKSEEGKADLKIMMNEGIAAISDLELIQQKYDLDSISNARIEARKVQAFVQMKDLVNAQNSLQNTYNTIPRNSEIKTADLEEINKANEAIFSSQDLSTTEKIDLQNTIDYSGVNDDNLVRENFRKSKLLEDENDPGEASKFLEESKRYITPKTTKKLAAEVYKKSYETNLERNKVSEAFDDLQAYINAKEIEIEELENNLKQQIEIVKGQRTIDIAEKDYDIKEKDKSLLHIQVKTQRIIIGLLLVILLASIVFFYFLYKNIKSKRRANQMLYLKSLRTQMNPHFIFNALNSVNSFIAQNDEKAANKFLADFSHLMRKVLDYSQKDFISIQDEIELNELYLKLEHFRFRDKFEYSFDKNLNAAQNLEIPPMLVQPFIENAVWHGLRYKETEGHLKITFHETKAAAYVTIEDDGIGREKSRSLKTKNQRKYNSTGLNNISERIKLINEIYHKNYKITVTDLYPSKYDKGTRVVVEIPLV